MYQWYAKSELCYAYIHDVDDSSLPEEEDEVRFPLFDGWPKYFSRGWTLQELIAPREVRFFNKYWGYMGDKRTLASALNRITRIPEHILADGLSSGRPSVAQIMSWAAKRTTTREEDRAYSLLGLFNVYMPMLYGEGKNAFQRLQLEIIRPIPIKRVGNILADDPSFFADCHDVVKLEPDAFAKQFEKDFPEDRNILVDERLVSVSLSRYFGVSYEKRSSNHKLGILEV
ncbi:hypothetical protein ID866_7775 [Astraeus odoratus]|nr:hypothetical protein ID866_7775 [Astraeus odoratus]